MLLGIKDKDKRRVGLFIEFKRKQYAHQYDTYKIEDFINGICPRKDYSRLARGKRIEENAIYDVFLQKLGYEYNYDDAVLSTITADERDILKLLEDENMTAFHMAVRALIGRLENYKEYALESVLYDALQMVLDLELNEKEFYELLIRFPMLDEIAREICGYFILTYIYRYESEDANTDWLKKAGLHSLTALCNQFRILNLKIRWEEYYDATIYCEKLWEQSLRSQNRWLMYHIQIARLFIVLKIQPSDFEKYANEVLENPVLSEGKEDPYTYEFYHVVGLHYFIERDYEQAWHYFIRAMHNEKYFFPEIVFLHHMMTVLEDKELPEEFREQRDIGKEYEVYKPIYRYFILKQKGENLHTLENYLWNHCCQSLDEFYPKWVMRDIVRTELAWISYQTKDKGRLEAFDRRYN